MKLIRRLPHILSIGDAFGLAKELKGEPTPSLTLEVALREKGHGPIIENNSSPGALGLYHIWHWCVPHGVAFSHSQVDWDEHKHCNGVITIPTYPHGESVAPRGASYHFTTAEEG